VSNDRWRRWSGEVSSGGRQPPCCAVHQRYRFTEYEGTQRRSERIQARAATKEIEEAAGAVTYEDVIEVVARCDAIDRNGSQMSPVPRR